MVLFVTQLVLMARKLREKMQLEMLQYVVILRHILLNTVSPGPTSGEFLLWKQEEILR